MEEQLVTAFQKNSTEQVRIILGEFKGVPVINVRVFWTKNGREWFPSAKGLTLSLEKLPELAAGINLAVRTLEDEEQPEVVSEWEKELLCDQFGISSADFDDDLSS